MNMQKKQLNWAKILSFLGLMWIASGHFLPLKVAIGGKELVVNAFSEFYLIPAFGIWRFFQVKGSYEKNRIKWMLILFGIYWFILPIFIKNIPLIDGTTTSLTTSYHTIGSIGFFLFFIAVLLFGKRADCGWNCTCVFTREIVGFAFRDQTKKGKFWWHLRHLKWVMLALVWSFFFFMLINPSTATNTYSKPMYKLILDIYYGTILLIPFIGHRNICRFLCPWSATWALLNKVGPYRIVADTSKCVNCGICDRECDMGIPVQQLIHKTGMINTGECMGCERCVRKCPKSVLHIEDFRDKLPGFNLSTRQRAIRVILGLTLIILPFTNTTITYIVIGIFAVALFISGLLGYCPVISLMNKFKSSKEDAL